jgi:hypothetical protein
MGIFQQFPGFCVKTLQPGSPKAALTKKAQAVWIIKQVVPIRPLLQRKRFLPPSREFQQSALRLKSFRTSSNSAQCECDQLPTQRVPLQPWHIRCTHLVDIINR